MTRRELAWAAVAIGTAALVLSFVLVLGGAALVWTRRELAV